MRPAKHDWPVYAGEPSVLRATFTDGTNPLTLTGTWTAQARRYPGSPEVVEIAVDASAQATGVLALTVPAGAFSSRTENWEWDLQGSTWGTVLAGKMPVTGDVTRDELATAGSVTDLVAALGPNEVEITSTAALGPKGEKGDPGVGASRAVSVLCAAVRPRANENFSLIIEGATGTPFFTRVQSSGAIGAWAMFDIPPVQAGNFQLNLAHSMGPQRGIYTVDVSQDNAATWTTLGTRDGYNASVVSAYDIISGLVVATATPLVVRLTMATKNAASSGYLGTVSAIGLLRNA